MSNEIKDNELDILDDLCAAFIMGAVADADCPFGPYFDICGMNWRPTRNIAQAWKCLEKLDVEFSVYSPHRSNDPEKFVVNVMGNDFVMRHVRDSSLPLAIVKACLAAVGVSK